VNTVTRPNLNEPNAFQFNVGKDMAGWFVEGLLENIARLEERMQEHYKGNCDVDSPIGCAVRTIWIVDRYGSLQAGAEQGIYQSDCSQDLAYLHKELAALFDMVMQIRYLQSRPDSKGMAVEAALAEQATQVVQAAKRTMLETGELKKDDIKQLLDDSGVKVHETDDGVFHEKTDTLLQLKEESTGTGPQPIVKPAPENGTFRADPEVIKARLAARTGKDGK